MSACFSLYVRRFAGGARCVSSNPGRGRSLASRSIHGIALHNRGHEHDTNRHKRTWSTVSGSDGPSFGGGATPTLGLWLRCFGDGDDGWPPRMVDIGSMKLLVVIKWPEAPSIGGGGSEKFRRNCFSNELYLHFPVTMAARCGANWHGIVSGVGRIPRAYLVAFFFPSFFSFSLHKPFFLSIRAPILPL